MNKQEYKEFEELLNDFEDSLKSVDTEIHLEMNNNSGTIDYQKLQILRRERQGIIKHLNTLHTVNKYLLAECCGIW